MEHALFTMEYSSVPIFGKISMHNLFPKHDIWCADNRIKSSHLDNALSASRLQCSHDVLSIMTDKVSFVKVRISADTMKIKTHIIVHGQGLRVSLQGAGRS